MTGARTSEDSWRERKKAQTRMEFTRAAVKLFRERGFEATTVEDIAAAASSSPRTYFRYFGTKEDVLFGDARERLEALRAQLDSSDGSKPTLELLRAAMIEQTVEFSIFDDPQLESECVALWVSEPGPRRRYSEIGYEWEAVIAEFLAREWDLEQHAVDCRVVATAAAGVLRAAFDAGAGGRESARAAVLRGLEFLGGGLDALGHR